MAKVEKIVTADEVKVEEVATEVPPVAEVTADEVKAFDGVEVETNIVSINIDGVQYDAVDGIITVPAEHVEIVKSHG